jgi:SRSO17 transposase
MSDLLDAAGQQRLQTYFSDLGDLLGHPRRRESFAMYAMGLLGEAERKSVEPIAARACADPKRIDALHQSLLHFLSQADWEDRPVRRFAARYAMDAMDQQAAITTWIIDDTGFLKQGTHSVGVQRQYTGSAGKVTPCQVGVSLTVSNGLAHLPIDFELYLPASWATDPARRREARLPEHVHFQTKVDLALGMIERAVAEGVPGHLVLSDCGYGQARHFRDTVYGLGLDYAVGIQGTTLVVPLDPHNPWPNRPVSAAELGRQLGPTAFRRIRWRNGTRRALASRFVLRRVRVVSDDRRPLEPHPSLGLLLEWPDGEPAPTTFVLTTLPARMSLKSLVRLVKERYRTEQMYEEMKGEVGLDHYEGRRFRGWHHHVTVALCCYAFVIAERARLFPPSATRQGDSHPLPLAA